MDHSAFEALLNKYLAGKCSEEEQRLIHYWYELLDDGRPYFHHPSEWDRLENKLWENIQVQKGLSLELLPRQTKKIPVYRLLKWMTAACVILMLGALTVFYFLSDDSSAGNEVRKDWVVENNNTTTSKTILLEDGSSVSLKPGSRIEYPLHFPASSREVFLEGEAFFEVKKDPLKAFFVYNNNLVTEVLGTSFNIIIRNNKIEVLVKTGRVAVYENGKRLKIKGTHQEDNKIVITPNQKVIYDNHSRNFTTALVDTPVVVKPPNQMISFRFDETPFSEVLKAIESNYGLEITLENDKMKLCPFSGDISQQDLYTKLELICQAFHATYEIKGVRILIKGGRECN